jgi:hypothetical protein
LLEFFVLLPFPANGEPRNTEFRSQEPVGYRATMRMAEDGSFVTQELRPAKVAEVIELSERIGFWNSTQILLLIRVNA